MQERIETKLEIAAYLQNLKYALQNGARIYFQEKRYADTLRDVRYSNQYALADLFPEEDPIQVLRRELMTLTAENYIRTVKDINRPNNSEMREFGKVYEGKREVYIKIRVELMKSGKGGVEDFVFVMSFHYSTKAFSEVIFPYQKTE